jgi:hypothetical protein
MKMIASIPFESLGGFRYMKSLSKAFAASAT